MNMANPVVQTYSLLAEKYDDELNLRSCWGRAAEKILGSLVIEGDDQVVLDVGCGTGRALSQLASRSQPNIQFVGIEPAENMRKCALRRIASCPNISILGEWIFSSSAEITARSSSGRQVRSS